MAESEIHKDNPFQNLIEQQKLFFNSNTSKSINFRLEQLKKLKKVIEAHRYELYDAIFKDFGKSRFETEVSELSLVFHELNLAVKKIKKWSRRKKVTTGLSNFPAKSYIIPEPLGNTLVIGPWNYPIQLTLIPVISSISAGNTVILKTSELPAKTSAVIAKMINENFPEDYLHVVEGAIPETEQLLQLKFDKIFFTGSTPVGKIVYKAAAKNLTPVTLELGGKSPTFVFADCNLKRTVQRLVWAKFLNAGQTCVAPDYILVEEKIKDRFIEAMITEIAKYHPDSDEIRENYLQIINHRNFDRLCSLIDERKVCFGGKTNREKRYISPTLLSNVTFEDKIMEDEIFGPLLPVLSFSNLDDTISKVKSFPKPLALYAYTKNRKTVKKLLTEISFGGGAINDSVMQLTNSNLPFGGVGFSGMGSYHGKTGFDTFSHFKSILDKPFWFEPGLKYAPYSRLKLKIIKLLVE